MAYLKKHDAHIFFETLGSAGPWITFINGYTRSSSDFRPIAEKLAAQGFQVLLIDNRGSGKTHTLTPFTFFDWGEDVVDLWSQLDITESHLVGFSMGGLISQYLAQRHVLQVSSLVLVGSTRRVNNIRRSKGWDGDAESVEETLREYVHPKFYERNRVLMRAMAKHIANSNKDGSVSAKIEQQKNALKSLKDAFPDVSTFQKPSLIIHGNDDQIVPREEAYDLHQTIIGSRMRIYQDAGHLLLIEKNTDLLEDLMSFFTDVQKPSS